MRVIPSTFALSILTFVTLDIATVRREVQASL